MLSPLHVAAAAANEVRRPAISAIAAIQERVVVRCCFPISTVSSSVNDFSSVPRAATKPDKEINENAIESRELREPRHPGDPAIHEPLVDRKLCVATSRWFCPVRKIRFLACKYRHGPFRAD